MRHHTTIRLSEHIHETPEGFLLCLDVPIARTGVMEYAAEEVPVEASGGLVLVHRSEGEVFAPATIASFEGKPVTLDHPDEFVTPENWRKLTVGFAQNVRRGAGDERDLLLADLLITDAEAIGRVRGGLREVSCGYDADYEQVSAGVGRQRSIRGNHIALVSRGRCGARCTIKDKEPTMKKGFFDKLFGNPKVRKAMDEALAEEKGGESASEKKEESQATDEDALERIAASLEELKLMMRAVLEGKGEGEGEQPSGDEETGAAEDEETEGGEEQARADDEEAEGEKKPTGDRAARTADSDTLRRAALLAPAISFRASDSDCAVKRASLRMAMRDGAVKKTVDACLRGQSLDRVDCVSLDAAFVAASEVAGAVNNKRTADSLTKAKARDFGKAVTPAEINRLNREYHDKRGK